MSHQCPKPGCTTRVPANMLACRPDWYSIPKPIRAAVWKAWNGGEGAGTAEHDAALTAAINYLRRPA